MVVCHRRGSALRTARQYPRIASASMSLRFSTARSIGRTPRRCFFSSKLRMPISFIHRLRCFTHIVEVTYLMRNVRQHRLNRIADGVLPIRDDPTDGNVNHLSDLAKQACEIRFTGTRTRFERGALPQRDSHAEPRGPHDQRLVVIHRWQA